MVDKIYIFTMNGCGHCKSLKSHLKKLNISFVDVDVDENEVLWNEVVKQTGYDYVPTVYVTKDGQDSGTIYVPSVDYEDEKDIIRILSDLNKKTEGN